MRSLARSVRRVGETGGEFLAPVFLPLETMKMKARMGTVTFIAGPPGAYKTGFVLYWVLRLNRPTLFFSADGEEFEMAERSAAIVTGDTMETVRRNFSDYEEPLSKLSSVRFIYNDSPTYTDLELEVAAYAEVYGQFPEIIVIDNLMNVTGDEENEWAAMRTSARVIHRLTRITKAAVLVLHHMADDRTDPTTPAPRKSLQGKVGQLPKAIFSLALDGNQLKLAPVKLRWGPGDASGQTYATLYVDGSTNRIFNSYNDMTRGVPA